MSEEEDDHIGPYNGHNKSEALPNGCAIFTVIAVCFPFLMWGIGAAERYFK